MKNEIRGLKAGKYFNTDSSACLNITKTDHGVRIEVIDKEFDLWESWLVADSDIADFKWGSLSESQRNQMDKKEQ